MKKYIIGLLILLANPTFAASTTGYAWSESLGWFDFSNVMVTDTVVTGYAYNENTGWLVLDGVVNTNGTLSGYAWSESVGYFNFVNTTIQNGSFKGYAYNENTGFLSFETGTNVTTAWVPTVVTTPTVTPSGGVYYGGGSSGGSSALPLSLKTPTTQPQVNTPTTTPNNLPNNQIITTLANSKRDLKQNSKGEDVKLLQQFLNSQGFTISKTGAGSVGKETTLFGGLTKQALIRFQIKNSITPAVGYFGPVTRDFIRSLLIKN